jgi:hypothetical protein
MKQRNAFDAFRWEYENGRELPQVQKPKLPYVMKDSLKPIYRDEDGNPVESLDLRGETGDYSARNWKF